MDPSQAAETLDEVRGVRRLTRRTLRSFTYPMAYYGAAALGAGTVQALAPAWLGLWWVVAGLAGAALVERHYRRRGYRLGAYDDWRVFALGSAAMAAGIAAVVALGPGPFKAALAWVVVGVVYLGFGALGADLGIGLVGAALIVAALTSLLTPAPGVEVDLAAGAVLLGAAAWLCAAAWWSAPRLPLPRWWA
ncbi:MAG TPA: hypothetical protein VE152_02800 [Acidimicrobiales bacterium]|nr:hypothetical protein [Acidimicrobiales bacterium]